MTGGGLVSLAAKASAVADQVRMTWPDLAAWTYRILGRSFLSLGPPESVERKKESAKAIMFLEQAREIAVEAGDRESESAACIILAQCLWTLGQFAKAIRPSEQVCTA